MSSTSVASERLTTGLVGICRENGRQNRSCVLVGD
jgi:hypothetical protein